jgi:hypothetical protein
LKKNKQPEKYKEARRVYEHSPKRIAWKRAYEYSPKRKESHRIRQAKYHFTPNGIETNKRYEQSAKGKETRKRYRRLPEVIAKRKEYAQKPHIKQKANENGKKFKMKLRTTLMNLLGNRCANPNCLVPGGCTDIRCLHIDHINGNGYMERTKFGDTRAICRYYIKHPKEATSNLQILCSN